MRRWAILLVRAGVASALVGVMWGLRGEARERATDGEGGDASRGAVLSGLAGCAACHTPPERGPDGARREGAGGFALVTEFGTFYGPNLTPDPVHGIGSWTYEDWERALRQGKSPEGRPYYPSFPYTATTGLDDQDLRDLWAWARALPPDPRPDTPHALTRYRQRSVLGLWRMLGFRQGWRPPAEAATDPELARGAYLAEVVGHCGACHTPRGATGIPRARHALAGTRQPPEPGPNLTPHPDGLGHWSMGDWLTLLADGMTPEGDIVGGEMWRVVRDGTSKLPEADRRALARWLLAQPGRPNPPPRVQGVGR